jgi:transposase
VHALREILDAIFYIVRSGCAWRLLPHDFPPWKTVHHYFRRWRLDGTWERMHSALRERVRVGSKRNPKPSAAIVDSQGRSRPRAWCAKSAVTTEPRRSKEESAIRWWTPRVWCSKPKSTAHRSKTLRGHQAALLDTNARSSAEAPLSAVAGRRIHRRRQGRGLGPEGFGADRRDRAPP